MQYREQFRNRLNQLKIENRYRNFVELERHAGRHPHATWNSPSGPQDVVIWCSNDYLGMGQHPAVLDAMQSAISQSGSGAGGTRNISGTSTAIVELEEALAALHNKPRALVLTSGYVANEASISALAGLLDDVVILLIHKRCRDASPRTLSVSMLSRSGTAMSRQSTSPRCRSTSP